MSQVSEEDEAKKAAELSRPVWSLPVSGTPWCVVWTGDAKTFFYNPTSKMSVWERPPELENRPDVEKMLSTTPPEVQKIRQQLTGEPAAPAAGQDTSQEPPAKKAKTEGQWVAYYINLVFKKNKSFFFQENTTLTSFVLCHLLFCLLKPYCIRLQTCNAI